MNDLEAKKEIINVAREMLNNNLHLIIGCRMITGLSCSTTNYDDDIYIPFRAVDSETDHFPIGSVRDLCDSEYLKRVDAEIDSYLDVATEDIFNACFKLLSKLSKDEENSKPPIPQ